MKRAESLKESEFDFKSIDYPAELKILILLAIIAIATILYTFISLDWNILTKNFYIETWGNTLLTLALGIFAVYFTTIIVLIQLANQPQQKEKWIKLKNNLIKSIPKILLFILISFLLFTIGLVPLDSLFGKKEISLLLRDNLAPDATNNGKIICNTNSTILIENSLITCEIIESKMQYLNGTINLINYSGNTEIIPLKQNNTFIAPGKNMHISFTLNFYNSTTNKTKTLTTGAHITFNTYEEEKQREKEFATYLLALIGFSLISTPTLLKNLLKSISKREDNYE